MLGKITFLIIILGVQFGQAQQNDSTLYSKDKITSKWTSIDKVRIKEIISQVMQSPENFTPKVHKEFWALIDKLGSISNEEINGIKNLTTTVGTIYSRLVWEDALWALKSGRPFKSLDRETIEKQLVEMRLLTEWRVRESEKFIEKIANRQPVTLNAETEVIMDEDAIVMTLANIDAVIKRIEGLFTRPEQEPQSIRHLALLKQLESKAQYYAISDTITPVIQTTREEQEYLNFIGKRIRDDSDATKKLGSLDQQIARNPSIMKDPHWRRQVRDAFDRLIETGKIFLNTEPPERLIPIHFEFLNAYKHFVSCAYFYEQYIEKNDNKSYNKSVADLMKAGQYTMVAWDKILKLVGPR